VGKRSDRSVPRQVAPRTGSRAAGLRELLRENHTVVAPGVVDALGARLVEQAGFNLVYVTGAGIANAQFGLPDVGLVPLTDIAEHARRIAAATSLPILIDGDTGHGGPLSVMRTVQLFEQAGVAGVHFEDQQMPKRCGHFDGKALVSVEEMLAKLEAARTARTDPDFVIALRTDARAVEGFEAAIERGRAFAEAGADAVFIEAPLSVEELERIPKELPDVPLIVNIVEGGKTPELSLAELSSLGYRIVIHANLLLRVMAKAAQDALGHLAEHGESRSLADRMLAWKQRQELVSFPEFEALEDSFYEFARRITTSNKE
jgi:2,3-dimethylmalate lyase